METSEYNRCQISVYRGLHGLQQIRDDWRDVTGRISHKKFFHHYGWYKSYLDNLEPNKEAIFFVMLWLNNTPVCILPLRESVRKYFGIPLKTLEIPSHSHMSLSDIIVADGVDVAKTIKMLLEYLRESLSIKWDVLCSYRVYGESCLLNKSVNKSLPDMMVRNVGKSKYLECDLDYDKYLKGLPERFKKNMRRKLRNANEMGSIKYRLFSDAEDFDTQYEEFIKIEASGWKGGQGAGTAIVLHQNIKKFYQDLNNTLDGDSKCIVNLMSLGGHYIAGQYCVLTGDTLYLLKIAFDEKYASISPGYLILNKLIQQSCQSPEIQRISFVTGADWNDVWNPEWTAIYDVNLFNKTILGKVAQMLSRIKERILRLRDCIRLGTNSRVHRN